MYRKTLFLKLLQSETLSNPTFSTSSFFRLVCMWKNHTHAVTDTKVGIVLLNHVFRHQLHNLHHLDPHLYHFLHSHVHIENNLELHISVCNETNGEIWYVRYNLILYLSCQVTENDWSIFLVTSAETTTANGLFLWPTIVVAVTHCYYKHWFWKCIVTDITV